MAGEKDQVSEAISEHYRPQGAKDELPSSPEAIIVSLADKLDTLTGFFCIGVKPTGSKDPFALRRAALGVIRIIIDCGLKIPLKKVLDAAVNGYDFEILDPDLMPFIRQRLFVHLRDQKMRHDIVAASLASSDGDDISIITNRARALATFIDSNDGLALVGVWRRVSNILVAEEKRTNEVFGSDPDPELFNDIERELFDKLSLVPLREDDIQLQLQALVELQTPTDSFFNNLIVNHEDTKIRKNRLGLLAKIRNTMLSIADFRKIEG